MKKYKIYAGLNGSFGGATLQYEDYFDSEEDAGNAAYEKATEIYESYSGSHGLPSYEDACVEAEKELVEEDYENIDEYSSEIEDYTQELYSQYQESWLDYYIEKVSEESNNESEEN